MNYTKGALVKGALCVLLAAVLLYASTVLNAEGSALNGAGNQVAWRIVERVQGGVVLEAEVPERVAQKFSRQRCAENVQGSRDPHYPAAPDRGAILDEDLALAVLIGVPEPGRATVEVEALQTTALTTQPGPCVTTGGSGPVDVVVLEDVGWLRDQPLVRLTLRPVVSHGDGTERWVQSVRLRIAYRAPAGQVKEADASFAMAVERMVVGGAVPPTALALREHRAQLIVAAGRSRAAGAGDPEALRIVVDDRGMTAVTGAQLEAAGWDMASLDLADLTLESGGVLQALTVDDQGAPGLEASDRIVFRGSAMAGPYTRENVYWLSSSGDGIRMETRGGIPGEALPAAPFTATVHFEQDTALRYEAPASEGADRWMWSAGIVAPDQRTEVLTVTNVAAGPAHVRVALQAGSQTVADPDHHVVIRLNDTVIADESFDGLGVHMMEAEVPPGVLVDGDNALRIEIPGDTDADIDRVYLNWVDIEYVSGFRAQADRLTFSCRADGRRKFDLSGFTGPDIAVYDVTNPATPVVVQGVAVRGASGDYTAAFESECGGESHWEAVASGSEHGPVRIQRNSASDLRDPANGADYVIVVHEDLEAGVSELVASQIAAGRRVKVVLISDVYDEFSHGVFDPRAIRDFLRYAAANWVAPAPAYVLLVGEANLDYRRGYDQGPENLVPSMEIDLLFGGQATSDAWFSALDDDDVLPDLMLGRISATNPGQVSTAVDKILSFQSVGVSDDWRRRAIMVADDDDAADLEYTSERLISLLPPDVTTRRFYAGSYPRDQDLTSDIQAAINEGALVLNFTGHGNVDLWSPWPGGGQIFNNNAIAGLTNVDKLPIFTAATCMNGWFAHPLSPTSMSEMWLRHPNGGGVAAWSPTGISPSIGQEALLYPFYTGLFDGRGQTLGGLVIESMLDAYPQSGRWRDIIQMFVFMGDPSTVAAGASVRPTPTPVPNPNPPSYLPALPQGPSSRP